MTQVHQAPKPDELEISIFGPGRGECIVVHLGDNDWCVVDSCVLRPTGEPVALDYLRTLGNNAINRIKLLVATHWHDDHIRGLSSILRASQNAHFCCSMAVKANEFLTLVAAAPVAIPGQSGVEEFASILRELESRGKAAPLFAIENRRLLHLAKGARSFPVTVTALSPADLTIKWALNEIADLLPKEGETQRRIVNRSPNHASVVLWLEAGNLRALLGADLEQTTQPGTGWLAVLAGHQDQVPGLIFKVPHHGSISSDAPDVWEKMLGENPIAVLTPFQGGSVQLPKESDLQRIGARTSRLYLTSRGFAKPPRREPAVEKTMARVSQRRSIGSSAGHVRIRWSANDPNAQPQIETFNGAYAVGFQPS